MFNAMSMRGSVVPKLSFKLRSGFTESRVKSRSHQSFSKDANINNIMLKYKNTGLLVEPGAVQRYRQPSFGDFSDLRDLPETLNRSREANRDFMALPGSLRERFGNDVSNLLNFVSDPANLEEAIELELLPESARPKPPEAKKSKNSSKSVDNPPNPAPSNVPGAGPSPAS